MKPAEYFGALKRIRDKLEARFPLGQRVQMSPEGARRFKRCADKKGTVIGHEKGVSKARLPQAATNKTSKPGKPVSRRQFMKADPTP